MAKKEKNFSPEQKICRLKSDTDSLCVPCEIANAVAAFAAIGEAHPGKIDTSIIDRELEKGTNSMEAWLQLIEEVKKTAKDEAVSEAEMVTQHLYELICENEETKK